MMRYLRRTDLMFLIDTRWIYHPTILRMSEVFDGHRPELWMIRWRSVISNIYDIILEYRDREREIYYHNKPESHIYIYIMYIYICIYIYNIYVLFTIYMGDMGVTTNFSFVSLFSRCSFGQFPFLHRMEVGPLGAEGPDSQRQRYGRNTCCVFWG